MYNQLAVNIYEQNKAVGWWDDPDRCIYQTLQLVSTEIAEATEAERKDLMDDHLPDRKGGEVELADALIRVLDLGGRYNWEYNTKSPPNEVTMTVASIGGKHLGLNMALARLAEAVYFRLREDHVNARYSELINSIISVSREKGYDVMSALVEKSEYNLHRADHKRENRTGKQGQKSF